MGGGGDFSDAAPHSSRPLTLPVSRAETGAFFCQTACRRRETLKYGDEAFLLLTGHRMVHEAGESNTKQFPLQTQLINIFKTATRGWGHSSAGRTLAKVPSLVHKTRRGVTSL